jgi:hypothetical protein
MKFDEQQKESRVNFSSKAAPTSSLRVGHSLGLHVIFSSRNASPVYRELTEVLVFRCDFDCPLVIDHSQIEVFFNVAK